MPDKAGPFRLGLSGSLSGADSLNKEYRLKKIQIFLANMLFVGTIYAYFQMSWSGKGFHETEQ